jgi:hypothetical protein
MSSYKYVTLFYGVAFQQPTDIAQIKIGPIRIAGVLKVSLVVHHQQFAGGKLDQKVATAI